MFWKKKYEDLKDCYECINKESGKRLDLIRKLQRNIYQKNKEIEDLKIKLAEAEKIVKEATHDRKSNTKRK